MAGNAVRHSAQELATRVMQAPLHSFQRLRKKSALDCRGHGQSQYELQSQKLRDWSHKLTCRQRSNCPLQARRRPITIGRLAAPSGMSFGSRGRLTFAFDGDQFWIGTWPK